MIRNVVLLGLSLSWSGCRPHESEEPEQLAVRVGVYAVTARDFPRALVSVGTVASRPGHAAQLSAPGPARVARVRVAAGDHVERGDILVELERGPFEAASRSADAAVSANQAAYDRAVRLAQSGILPRKDVDRAAADLAQAQAAAVSSHRDLELATLRAPLAGSVSTMNAIIGESVDASQPLVEVVDPSQLDVVLNLTAEAAAEVREGAAVSLNGGQDRAGDPTLGTGIVSAVAVAVDSVTRTVAVRVRVTRALRPLRLGETVSGRIVLGVHPNAIAVPVEALVPEGEGFKVFVVDASGLARARPVTVGARADSLVEIIAGLGAGETVVTSGAYSLDDSVKVTRAAP